jgi:hypothetical protein
MPLFKRLPVLCVPRIVERPHEFKIVLCHVILPTSDSTGSPKHVLGCQFRRSFYTLARHHQNVR